MSILQIAAITFARPRRAVINVIADARVTAPDCLGLAIMTKPPVVKDLRPCLRRLKQRNKIAEDLP
jgi:hypothetical protein